MGRDGSEFAAQQLKQSFQSTRPCGARPQSPSTATPPPSFNPRARVGRDPTRFLQRATRNRFNPRARVGRDLDRVLQRGLQRGVSIHAPVWGATPVPPALCHPPQVSIHAPVWGATEFSVLESHAYMLFQSTRPCGARRALANKPLWLNAGFNPRARVGRDPRQSRESIRVLVSIHAPVWGATPNSMPNMADSVVSIHAPVWGATQQLGRAMTKPPSFNPRARVGRDRRRESRPPVPGSFNPRARVGRDPSGLSGRRDRGAVSIHAPVWGATRAGFAVSACRREFQSTRPCGARPQHIGPVGLESQVSIHAPVWGATASRFDALTMLGVSIHAPVWGATAARAAACGCAAAGFNPRARVGRDSASAAT